MNIVVVCCAPSAVELLGKAGELARKSGNANSAVTALCFRGSVDAFACYGAKELTVIPACEDDCAQGTGIADALRLLQPDAVLFPATVRGRFLSAWVAAKLQTGLTADCTALSLTEKGELLQIRPAFGGNLTAEIVCRTRRPQMASVRPGVFPTPDKRPQESPVRSLSVPLSEALLRRVAFTPQNGGTSLASAKVIVTGGKGIGGKEGFDTLAQLAELLHGAVGATRSAVDAGWITYDHQIGQTGVIVRPELYIAFGVSGLVQHVVGMSGAKTVIAVNSDRNAPIFSNADYGIVGDWRETAGKMIRFLKERKDDL